MLKVPSSDSLIFFWPKSLLDLYNTLTFPRRTTIFEIFLAEDAQIPKRNAPYTSSDFPKATRLVNSLLYYLLGYENYHSIDESIFGFLSIFSENFYPAFMFNYNQFLANNVHEQIIHLTTQGVYKYSSMIIHMFLFQRGDLLPIQLEKQDDQGMDQPVIHWKNLIRENSTKYTYLDFIDLSIHPVLQLINS